MIFLNKIPGLLAFHTFRQMINNYTNINFVGKILKYVVNKENNLIIAVAASFGGESFVILLTVLFLLSVDS